jgi:hypothetical protein
MDFSLRVDPRARVLIIIFGNVVTDSTFLSGFAAVKDFVNKRGPHHGITDFSGLESFLISNELLSQLGSIEPAFPIPMRRVVVASTPAAQVCTRIVQSLRAGTFAPIEIAGTTREACALLGTSKSRLVEVLGSQP